MSRRVRKSSAVVDLAGGQPLEQRPVARWRELLRLGNERVAVGREPERGPAVRKMDDQDAAFDRGDASGAELGIEAVGQVVPDGPSMHACDLTGCRACADRGRAAALVHGDDWNQPVGELIE